MYLEIVTYYYVLQYYCVTLIEPLKLCNSDDNCLYLDN